MSGSANKTLEGRALDNAREASWTGPGAILGIDATFNNLAGATFDVQDDAIIGLGRERSTFVQQRGPVPQIARRRNNHFSRNVI
jgi:hypothetical protein